MPVEHPARRAGLRSQDCVQRHARDEWLALFADDAVVEDPVGASPLDPTGRGHRGREALAKFYDQVIAPATVRFHFERSFACGDECAFVGSIATEREGMPRAVVDLVAVYRVNGAGQLVSLRAFWEFDQLLEKLRGGA